MPITPFLGEISFDPDTKRVMGLAFEMARVARALTDHSGLANAVPAKQTIELAKSGERDPDLLCEVALKEFRLQPL
jgi:hypothetical protein